MNELALFGGAGGGILGGILLGWNCRCAVELNAFCARRLMQRQNEGYLPPFPIWDDVCTFDGSEWAGYIDVVSGGFPCTDISIAGNGAGIDGKESGLWREMYRIIGEVRPRFVLVENSPALTFRGRLRVVGDLALLGYDMRWGIMGAEDAIWLGGTPVFDHERKRIWILAFTDAAGFGREQAGTRQSARSDPSPTDTDGERWKEAGRLLSAQPEERTSGRNQEAAESNGLGCEQVESQDDGGTVGEGSISEASEPTGGWWSTEPNVDRVVHGLANRVDRLTAIGNGQVPAVVKIAWETLSQPGSRDFKTIFGNHAN